MSEFSRIPFYNKAVPSKLIRPVSIEELIAHIGLYSECNTALRTKLGLLIDAATECFEKFSNFTIMEATYTVKFDTFCNRIQLRRYPLVSITSVNYIEEEDPFASQVVDASEYYVISDPFYSILAFDKDFDFPSVRAREQSISIVFLAGVASDASKVPADVKIAILEHATFMYENVGCDPEKSMPPLTKTILRKYKPFQLGGC